jgi:predicted CoA-binding protein
LCQTALPDLPSTSISVIIHPSLGLGILKSLYPTPPAPAEPRAIWFQPGAESDEIRAYAKERGIEDRVVASGQCILKQGDALMSERRIGAKM